MGKVRTSERSRTIEYAIRDVAVYADQVAKSGKHIYYLNIGDPVAFGFDTPSHIKEALSRAVQEGANSYSPSEGLPELRQAIAQHERKASGADVQADDVIVTNGVSEGIQMVLGALIEDGDELLMPGPAYPPYISYVKFFGGRPVTYETFEQDGWQPNVDDLQRKVSDRTRGIVIINPNNPTGGLYKEKVLKEILNVAGSHELPVISDEIYDQIVYGERFVSTTRLAKDVPVIGLNGFSKAYLMTGWRLGYVCFHDQGDKLRELKESVLKEARIRLCANTPVQKAGVAALNGPQDHIGEMMERLKERRDYAQKRLNEIKGVSSTRPEGAFYIFPRIHEVGTRWKSDRDFVLELLRETGVLLVHGSGFGSKFGAGHVRAVFLPPIETMASAFTELERFMMRK